MRRPIRGINDNRILNLYQIAFLKEFTRADLKSVFRLTGGAALSAFYLEHRLSEDLDFFSSEKVPFYILEDYLKKMNIISEISYMKQFDRNIFTLKFKNNSNSLKVEFTYYPLKNIDDICIVDGLQIDSYLDIVINKLCAIADRVDAKDYVDVYYALVKDDLRLEQLIEFAEKKCEIKGIRHILKSRLLQIPDGVNKLPLKVAIKKQDMESLFKKLIKEIIEKEIG